MKKNTKHRIKITSDFRALDNVDRDFENFKSRVANAVLDYIEIQKDAELVECLEKTSIFLQNISLQMEKVFENQDQAFKNQDDLVEIADDLFLTNQYTSSNTIH